MSNLPPGAPALYILLSLLGQERHGYDIMKQVERVSEGSIRLGPATLYTTIKRLLEAGLIKESGEHADQQAVRPGERRRYYALTAAGKQVIETELGRMEHLVNIFKTGKVHLV